jgi:CheY-like chemotaxis protein
MPIMTGTQATSLIRQAKFKGKILGVTGNALQHDIDEFIKHGADKVYLKPLGDSSYEGIFNGECD